MARDRGRRRRLGAGRRLQRSVGRLWGTARTPAATGRRRSPTRLHSTGDPIAYVSSPAFPSCLAPHRPAVRRSSLRRRSCSRRALPDGTAPARRRPAVPVHGDGGRGRQRLAPPRGGDRPRVPLAVDLGAGPADEDHARGRAALVRGPAGVAVARDRARRDGRDRRRLLRDPARPVARMGRRGPAQRGRGERPGRRCRFRSSSACRSPSSSSSGAPGRTGPGRCRSPRCWRCRPSGTAASRCCWP